MNDLLLGQTARKSRIFSAEDLAGYRQLCGDAGLFFGSSENELPGPLLGGMISDLLGTTLPGRGTNWLKQRYAFPRPAFVGQLITAEVEIVRLRPEKQLVNLKTTCTTTAGAVVCEGEALVLVRDLV